jgi:subtilase family serine protease
MGMKSRARGKTGKSLLALSVGLGLLFSATRSVIAAGTGQQLLRGHVPAAVARLAPTGRLPGTNRLNLAIGLPLRNPAALDEFLRQLYDPRSTNFHKFLTPQEFTARFGPTEPDYQAVIRFAESNGLTLSGTHPNRLVVDVEGSVSNIERAFRIILWTYRHPTEPREFFAPDTEPSAPANLPIIDVGGLCDYGRPRPLSRPVKLSKTRPLSFNGSGPNGEYAGKDFRNAYAPGTALTGAGQAVGLLEFSAYYKVDITNYENIIGMTNYVPLTNVVVAHASTGNNDEVALDIEMAIAMAPSLSRVIVYEGGNNTSPSSLLSRMANDNLARQLSCSWTWTGGPNSTVDTLLKQMAAQGQSFFQASGDDDAYTGANTLDNAAPVDSTNLTCVGGTTLTMNGVGVSWASETVWNYNLNGLPNTGSGGGISPYYTIPWWQTNVSMAANQGSTTFRNVPDVALTADNVFVCYGDGNTNGSIYYMGTSCAAPLWAGFCALVNQQMAASSAVSGITNVGFLNPALYAIGLGTNYSACFHDITTGNNIGTNTPGFFYATNGYDLCTGWGTPTGTNLINALAPYPYIITPPASQTATNGNNVAFSVVAGGQPPFSYRWLFNGTNLPAGGNVSGTTSNVLSITSVTTANVGNYSASVTNSCGSVTSSVATLTVVSPPVFSTQPTNQTVVAGSNAVFSATVSGTLPLVYQWRQNGTNLVNGGNISGATTNALTLTAVTTNNAGNYTLVVTNIYGPATSSIAVLTVVSAPGITIPPTNQTIQCGSNAAFSVTATGTAPLYFQWSLDSAPLAGATNTSLLLTNVHLPNHTVAVVVTNLYGSATSAVTLTVVDTLPPVITLNGANPFYVELGSAYIEAGATAYDLCAGVVPVSISGTVNTNAVSTNTVTYTATDGNGNTNTATRTVIVRDTTPPTILWSFTNLVLAAGTNCATPMPDVTGTNFIRATDLSPPLTITQSPTNNAALPLGTNIVVITVADAYGNTAYSTNQIIVQDQSPPVIWLQPQSQTNTVGASASFSVVATACTPLTFQWFFNNAALAAETNSTLTLSNLNATLAGNYFVVASAAGGSTTSSVATLTVNLLSPTIAGVVANANGSVTLDLTGAVGSVYILETTTNLSTANWLPLTTNTPGTNGAWQFTDLAATNYPQRFYRLMLTP